MIYPGILDSDRMFSCVSTMRDLDPYQTDGVETGFCDINYDVECGSLSK